MEASQGKDTDSVNRIRQLESEISQNILIARRQAEKHITDTQLQAKNLADQAVQNGQQNGKIASRKIISEAEIKAAFLIEKAGEEAKRLSNPTEETLNRLVQQAVNYICGKQS